MLSKKSLKIIGIVLIVAVMLFTFGSQVFADDLYGINPSPITPDAKATTLVNTILNYLMWGGIAIAVGMLIYIGIKYVTSSPDGKADIKGKLGVYILGFVLISAATTIVGIINTAISGAVA